MTWKMGALTTRATSVGYGEERAIRGSVVNPIWRRDVRGVTARSFIRPFVRAFYVCVAYLVVDDHVHGAVRGVGRQVRQVERLVHDTLACECSIAMKQNRHHL